MVRQDLNVLISQQQQDFHWRSCREFSESQAGGNVSFFDFGWRKKRLIDEWQEVPPIWDAVRYQVDQSAQKGQYILTSSATPNHKGILHSGAGRIGKLRMRPLSLYESGDSSGTVSLPIFSHQFIFDALMVGRHSVLIDIL